MKVVEQSSGDDYQAVFLGARHYFVLLVLVTLLLGLISRALYLQLIEQDFLTDQGVQRQIRTLETPAYRGAILDRFGTPLAISTPVDSVWVNPAEILLDTAALKTVADMIEIDYRQTVSMLKQRANREFVYLKRHLQPEFARSVAAVADGVYLQREYHRYYPAGEVVSHLVGFTDIDDDGQEGLELAYQDWLRAHPGQRKVIRNRHGEVIEELDQIKPAKPGKNIHTSIDMRLQYIAYRSLARAIKYHAASAGSAILLDALSGEILAMVNLPSYNPNRRTSIIDGELRNRALTDVFEPGSAIKPFTLAAALESGRYHPGSRIDTSPGHFIVSGHPVKDVRNFGELDLAGVLSKSSNVAASRIALSMDKQQLWNSFRSYGFGESSGVSFPGESAGYFRHYSQWQPLDHATMGFGYGMSLSITQLARAYTLLANHGQLVDLSLLRKEADDARANEISRYVMNPEVAQQVLQMMTEVVGPEGTAYQAAIPGYRVAGKTGTAKKSIGGGYQEDDYVAVFAGIAPASAPRLVMAIMIDEPTQNGYYGGTVAAPVFRDVVSNALRILDVAPDDVSTLQREQGA